MKRSEQEPNDDTPVMWRVTYSPSGTVIVFATHENIEAKAEEVAKVLTTSRDTKYEVQTWSLIK